MDHCCHLYLQSPPCDTEKGPEYSYILAHNLPNGVVVFDTFLNSIWYF